ncbi:MAG TPA: hypothetical protein VNS32_06440 [Flavisolibacter sp.]|nr:hypothetical protein [Flavisolibacter sp.]
MRAFISYLISILTLYTVSSCDNSNVPGSAKNQDNTERVAKITVKQPKQTTCILGEETFDSLLVWPRKIFDPAEDIKGFVQLSASVFYSPNELALLAYQRKKDTSYIVLFVEVLDSINKVKVICAKRILTANKMISFKSLCNTKCQFDYQPMGMLEVSSEDKVHTLRAWTIDKNRKVVYRVNPEMVDCQEAYETNYD